MEKRLKKIVLILIIIGFFLFKATSEANILYNHLAESGITKGAEEITIKYSKLAYQEAIFILSFFDIGIGFISGILLPIGIAYGVIGLGYGLTHLSTVYFGLSHFGGWIMIETIVFTVGLLLGRKTIFYISKRKRKKLKEEGKARYLCHICNEKFFIEKDLELHIKYYHKK